MIGCYAAGSVRAQDQEVVLGRDESTVRFGELGCRRKCRQSDNSGFGFRVNQANKFADPGKGPLLFEWSNRLSQGSRDDAKNCSPADTGYHYIDDAIKTMAVALKAEVVVMSLMRDFGNLFSL